MQYLNKGIRLLAATLCCISLNASAQTWEVGVFGGSSGYMGDFNQDNPFKFTDIAIGAHVRRNFDPYWSMKIGYTYAKIRGDDAKSSNEWERIRNLNFTSPIHELTTQVELNFLKYFAGGGNLRFTPYLFTGVSAIVFNPYTYYQGTKYNLVDFGTEGQDINHSYKTYALAIPYGAGVKYNIKGNWNVMAELGYRTAYTNYLDDVSGYYADKSKMVSDIARALSDRSGEQNGIYIGEPGVQRGALRKRDTYMFVGISLTYTFVSLKCPTF